MEIVQALAEAFQRRDHERPFEFYDPDIEWDASRVEVLPDVAGVYRGHEGVRRFWRGWLSAWADVEFDVQDVLDAGDEIVLLIHHQRQWGRHSGIATDYPPYAMVFTFREGTVIRFRQYADQDGALKAVGLEK